MKKITFLLTTAVFIGTSPIVKADTNKYVPYIGTDYAYTETSAKKFSPHHHNISLRIGSEYNSYFGTELFFMQSDTDKHSYPNSENKQSYRAYGLDAAAYLPLGCDKKIALMATAGIGEYVFKIKNRPQKHQNEHGYGYRFGGGLKYLITPSWQTRLLARYINFDHLSNYRHTTEYAVGIEYHFN